MNSLLSDSRMTMVFGAVVAVTAAIYVAFGPNSVPEAPHRSHRRKQSSKRKAAGKGVAEEDEDSLPPRGLHNSGNTCFVNAVLQAASACPALLLWLEELSHFGGGGSQLQQSLSSEVASTSSAAATGKDKKLRSSLLTVLRVVNGHDADDVTGNNGGEGMVGDPEVWAPALLFKTLRLYGWVVNSGEQDAHEFFQALISALEEEISPARTVATAASLLDTDVVSDENSVVPPPPEDAEEEEKEELEAKRRAEKEEDEEGEERRGRRRRRRSQRSRSSSGVVVRSGAELSLSNVRRQTAMLPISSLTPFTGTLTNKVSFKQTGKSKSPTSSTVFNNITLSLPQQIGNSCWSGTNAAAPVTLETLLQMFVSTESVHGSCNSTTTSAAAADSSVKPAAAVADLVKQLTFARLPDCLCFHIQRTAFENGVSFKRSDSVLFPTILNMDNYAYNRQLAKLKAVKSAAASGGGGSCATTPAAAAAETPLGDDASLTSWMTTPDDGSIPGFSTAMDSCSFNNNYALRAVVVHLGGIDSGHYVTYRREPVCPVTSSMTSSERQPRRWFYTSDALVKEVSVEDVLKTNPYMLFYEKIHAQENGGAH